LVVPISGSLPDPIRSTPEVYPIKLNLPNPWSSSDSSLERSTEEVAAAVPVTVSDRKRSTPPVYPINFDWPNPWSSSDSSSEQSTSTFFPSPVLKV
jgi:hypothetical protein